MKEWRARLENDPCPDEEESTEREVLSSLEHSHLRLPARDSRVVSRDKPVIAHAPCGTAPHTHDVMLNVEEPPFELDEECCNYILSALK